MENVVFILVKSKTAKVFPKKEICTNHPKKLAMLVS